jgi:hypothetical protein
MQHLAGHDTASPEAEVRWMAVLVRPDKGTAKHLHHSTQALVRKAQLKQSVQGCVHLDAPTVMCGWDQCSHPFTMNSSMHPANAVTGV